MTSKKSKKVLEYLYRYAMETGNTEVIESLIPYRKNGLILWEAAHGIYDIICSASDDNREMILSEIQSLSEREIEQRLHELVEDTSIINAMDISLEDRMQVARAIYQTLRQIVNQRPNPKEVIHIINQNLFRGDQVISIQNVHIASHS